MKRISPIDLKILQTVDTILQQKPSLVKIGKGQFDNQFTVLMRINGLSHLIDEEIDYLTEEGLLQIIDKKDRYMGNTTHYILTYKAKKLL